MDKALNSRTAAAPRVNLQSLSIEMAIVSGIVQAVRTQGAQPPTAFPELMEVLQMPEWLMFALWPLTVAITVLAELVNYAALTLPAGVWGRMPAINRLSSA